MDRTRFHGPKGLYSIKLQDDGQWSVELDFNKSTGLLGSGFVRDSADRMGWETRDEAMKVAYVHAGINQHFIFPPPDRRGLVEHSRKMA